MPPGGIDYNLIAGMGRSGAQSHQAGLESRLVLDQVAQDETTRNALAGYLESAPEERDARLNALVAADPKTAGDVLTIEHSRADRASAERQQHAQRALTELQAIQRSSNPGIAFRLMAERQDEDNPLRGLMEQLAGAGAINLEDGISDEEAAQIADIAIVQLTPVASSQDVERADPADVRAMRAFGYEMTPEGFAKYNADKGSGGNTVADQLAVLQAQLAMDQRRDQIERDRRADEATAEKQRVERAQTRSGLRRSIAQTARIADLTTKLEGSFLQAGLPASSWRSAAASTLAGVGAALGMDTEKLRSDVSSFNQLKKNLSDQLINLMSNGNLSNQTNALLQQYQDSLANTETSPGAIMAIQANIAETLLDESDAQGIEILDRDQVEANIKKWHEYESPQGDAVVDGPAIARRVGEIGKMTGAELTSLQSGAGDLTTEMLEAASRRWDELNAAPRK